MNQGLRPAIFTGTALGCLLSFASSVHGQQVTDTSFVPRIESVAYAAGTGPRVMIDGGHVNFHTVNGRYLPFARLATRDGYRVSGGAQLNDSVLSSIDILVIANALAPANDSGHWHLPTPSAFTRAEIAVVHRFVDRGGSLLLIADHMPFAGAAEDLAASFGISWINGFAFDAAHNSVIRFARGSGLAQHPIFEGRTGHSERIDSIVAFTGSAFWLANGGTPLLVLSPGSRVLLPHVAWQFSDSTPSVSGTGLLQGAALRVGRGRVLAAGEAAMFSAQRTGPGGKEQMGFNAPSAPQNVQFVLNVLHWLSGLLPLE